NLDRPTRTERYDTTLAGNLVARSDMRYDDRNQAYQRVQYGVNPTTGQVGNALTDNTWFDPAGNVLKTLPAGSQLFSKCAYDGVGREVKRYVGYDLSETSYADASSVSDDTLLEQVETAYDGASNIIQVTTRQRYHNATGTGELGSPSSAQPLARVSYAASW